MTEDDCYVSYLPASHSFEQAVFGLSLSYGVKCGFFSGNVQKISEDLAVLKPTIFPSVPRLYNRIYQGIQDKLKEATGVKAWLAKKAVDTKLYYLRESGHLHHWLYDKLLFNTMKQRLGGSVRVMITGSAPISGDVLEFLKICFCCDICEGYGMTETCAGSCLTYEGDPTVGIVGGPLQNVKIKLRDIPEMGHLSTNPIPAGEVCFWGPSIMKGYFRNPEKTAEAFTDDGWLRSGDVCVVFKNGAMKIVDRAKNIFKLSQGEYIAPEKLENVYITCSVASQVWVYGDSLKDHVIMFLVADPKNLEKLGEKIGQTGSADELCKNQKVIQAIFEECMGLADGAKFNPLERPKQIVLMLEPFSVENDMLTPTFKLKRNVAA